MFITNGNRRPKPTFKMTVEADNNIKYELNRLLENDGKIPDYLDQLSMDKADAKKLVSFRDAHKGKTLIAMFGNEKKKEGSRKRHVEVTLYALPKASIDKIDKSHNKNPTVHLKSDFIFDDKDVGTKREVTVFIDKKGEYAAYEVETEAEKAFLTQGMTFLGRFPFIVQDGELHVQLPLKAWHTRKDYLLKKKEVLPTAIQITSATTRKKDSVKVEDATQNPSKPRKTDITADVDIKALADGRYLASRNGVNVWLIKATFKVGTLMITNLLLLAHDNPSVEEVPQLALPDSLEDSK